MNSLWRVQQLMRRGMLFVAAVRAAGGTSWSSVNVERTLAQEQDNELTDEKKEFWEGSRSLPATPAPTLEA